MKLVHNHKKKYFEKINDFVVFQFFISKGIYSVCLVQSKYTVEIIHM